MLTRSIVCLFIFAAALLWGAMVFVPSSAHAGWLTRLAKEAGEAGGGSARKGAGQLDEAAANLGKLPKVASAGAVAASVSGEGHWTFINKTGQRFTAANDAEMARLGPFLFPDGVGPAGLNIYVTRDSVFKYPESLKALPKSSKVWLSDGSRAYQLRYRAVSGQDPALYAQVRRDVFVQAGERSIFDEALWRLERPLKRNQIRVLSLTGGGPASLPVVARKVAGGAGNAVEKIDPQHLGPAIEALKGQTVVLTGRITGDRLVYRAGSGFEAEVDLVALRQSASHGDVDLIVLNSPAPRQPGVRNWLWQTVGIEGLETALNSKTYADFIGALAGGGRSLEIKVVQTEANRTTLSAIGLSDGLVAPGSETIGDVIAEVASEVAGSVVTSAIELHGKSESRAKELDRRIIPGVSSDLQIGFLLMVVAGVLGWPVARRWWRWVWPHEERQEYGSWLGYRSAQLMRFVFFLVLFLPLIGVPAMIWNFLLQAWAWLTLPWRILKWMFGSGTARSTSA